MSDDDEKELRLENEVREFGLYRSRPPIDPLRLSMANDSAIARRLVASSTYKRSSILAIKLKAKLSSTLE